jgi:hypothetical protein
MNETSMDSIFEQLEAAEERLQPFLNLGADATWVTDNDQQLLDRVLAAIASAQNNSPSREYAMSPSLALTSALHYLDTHRHTMSPIGSPLMNLLHSPQQQHARKSRKKAIQSASPLSSLLGVPTATTATTTATTTTASTKADIAMPKPATTTLSPPNPAIPIKKTTKTSKKTGKKKRTFGKVLNINTLHNTSSTRKTPFKQKTRLVHTPSSSVGGSNMNVLETF